MWFFKQVYYMCFFKNVCYMCFHVLLQTCLLYVFPCASSNMSVICGSMSFFKHVCYMCFHVLLQTCLLYVFPCASSNMSVICGSMCFFKHVCYMWFHVLLQTCLLYVFLQTGIHFNICLSVSGPGVETDFVFINFVYITHLLSVLHWKVGLFILGLFR